MEHNEIHTLLINAIYTNFISNNLQSLKIIEWSPISVLCKVINISVVRYCDVSNNSIPVSRYHLQEFSISLYKRIEGIGLQHLSNGNGNLF